jgi:hypothetical protein
MPGFTLGGGLGRPRDIESQRRHGERADLDIANVHLGAGHFTDENGEETVGLRVHGGGLSGQDHTDDAGNPDEMEFGVGTFDGGIYMNDETAVLGGQASAGELAFTLGSDADANSQSDTNVRGGISAGPGFAVRAHYGDTDGDQTRELGFGVDAGPVSFDVRSEVLGRAWNWMTD